MFSPIGTGASCETHVIQTERPHDDRCPVCTVGRKIAASAMHGHPTTDAEFQALFRGAADLGWADAFALAYSRAPITLCRLHAALLVGAGDLHGVDFRKAYKFEPDPPKESRH